MASLKKTNHLLVRAVAATLDSLLVCALWYYFIEAWGHTGTADTLTSETASTGKVVTGMPAVSLLLLTACYWMIPEWILGATIGKLALGLRVTTLDARPISFGQSFKRNLLRLVDFFPFYLTGFLAAKLTPNHQRIGDLWAQTIVISTKNNSLEVGDGARVRK